MLGAVRCVCICLWGFVSAGQVTQTLSRSDPHTGQARDRVRRGACAAASGAEALGRTQRKREWAWRMARSLLSER